MDEYLEKSETAVKATQYEVVCGAFANEAREDMYLANLYDQVRESEGWTEAEVSEVTYLSGFVPAADMRTVERVEEPACEPGVVLTIDQKGRMTPMATGVMVVKDVAR